LCFTWQTEALEEATQCIYESSLGEVHQVDEGMHDSDVLGIGFSEELSKRTLVNAIVVEEETGNVFGGVRRDETSLIRTFNPFLGL